MSGKRNTRKSKLENVNLTRDEINVLENLHLRPLLMPEIVRELVKFIDTKELPKCRFVCKLWNEEIIREMKKRSIFSFEFYKDKRVKNFLENGQAFFGFKNIKVVCGILRAPESSISKLLSIHGKFLRRLELRLFTPPRYEMTLPDLNDLTSLASLQELEYLKFKSLPTVLPVQDNTITMKLHKLTTLDIYLRSRTLFPSRDQKFFKQLLEIAPNLTELYLRTQTQTCAAQSNVVTNCTRALLALNPPKLKRLYFQCKILKTLITILSTHLISKITTLFLEDLEGFTVNFESDVSGNKITIKANDGSDFSGIPASIMIDYIQKRLAECEKGVSCTQLLKTFLFAFQERIQARFPVAAPAVID